MMNDNINKMQNLSEYFINSVKKFPTRTALVVDDKYLTYQELFNRASHLSFSLLQFQEKHCALLSARGVDSYVGLLAILMAGKTYIPLSTKSPQERNLEILRFSEAAILIVDEKCTADAAELLRNYKDPLIVAIPSLDSLPKNMQSLNQSPLQKPFANDDAYLLFTSGSTGIPKAVMTTHASAVEYIDKMLKRYQPNEHDRFSQLTDLSFDVAMHELFLCWASGGCLYTIADAQLAGLHRFINQHQLTVWTSVPSILSLLKQWNRLNPGIFPSIRCSTLLGEPLAEELVRYWHSAAPNSIIDNLYGPTEATIIFTEYRWQPGLAHSSGYVPIGVPLAGQDIAILDIDRKPVAKGAVGELYLAGSQVTKGYWNNPKLTREKFVKIDSDQSKYWYKTGDFVYWDDSYGLVFKGRDIDILKVRGGRVEKLEVEMVLRDLAKTNTVAIVPFQKAQDGVVLNLMAFVGYSSVNDADILKNCQRKLPGYMIPSKIIRVESLPITKNGKVDYQFLNKHAEILMLSTAKENAC